MKIKEHRTVQSEIIKVQMGRDIERYTNDNILEILNIHSFCILKAYVVLNRTYSVVTAFRTEKKEVYSHFHWTHLFQSHNVTGNLMHQAIEIKMYVSAEMETSWLVRWHWLASNFSECQILTVSSADELRPGGI